MERNAIEVSTNIPFDRKGPLKALASRIGHSGISLHCDGQKLPNLIVWNLNKLDLACVHCHWFCGRFVALHVVKIFKAQRRAHQTSKFVWRFALAA
jgi:hypothetical protein